MKLVVQQGTRAVVHVDGLLAAVLEPGRHQLPGRPWRRRVAVVDVREEQLLITQQEAPTADLPGLRFSIALRHRVSDPARWLQVAVDPAGDLRLAAQVSVRDWVSERELDTVVAARREAVAELTAAVARTGERLGAEVLEVSLRDVSVPGDVRRAQLDAAVARWESQTRLERARGETAALRALANGSRALQDNAALLQLRTVQAAAEAGGSLVLHLGRGDEPAG